MLLLPVFLFLLGLPNKPPPMRTPTDEIDAGELARPYATGAAIVAQLSHPQDALSPYTQVTMVAMMHYSAPRGDVPYKDFKALEAAVHNDLSLKDKWVKVKGQFVPSRSNDRVFFLARQKINCCAPDAVQLNVPIISRDSVARLNIKQGDWVLVEGKVDFRMVGGVRKTILLVERLRDINPTTPEMNLWVY